MSNDGPSAEKVALYLGETVEIFAQCVLASVVDYHIAVRIL